MPTENPAHDRAHILMVGTTTPSHVYPNLSLIDALVGRGHRVSYAIGAPLAGLVRPTGADVLACTTLLPTLARPGLAWPQDADAGMQLFVDEAVHVLPQLLDALDDDRPELILHDVGGLAGPVAGLRWSVPAVQVAPSYADWDAGAPGEPDHRRWPPGGEPAADAVEAALAVARRTVLPRAAPSYPETQLAGTRRIRPRPFGTWVAGTRVT